MTIKLLRALLIVALMPATSLAGLHCDANPDIDTRFNGSTITLVPGRGDLGWLEIRDEYYEADQWRWQYPSWAYDQIKGTNFERMYDLRYASNPFLLNGDFDGDGQIDVAVAVEFRHSKRRIGVIIVHRSGGVYFVHGGGNWELYPKGNVGQGVDEEEPPKLLGDALLFVKPEATGSLTYWNGKEYTKYHQGD